MTQARKPEDTMVAHAMTPLPYTIGPNHSLAGAVELMRTLGVHHLPVIADGTVRGVLSFGDSDRVDPVMAADARVADAMAIHPCVVRPDAPLADLVHEMNKPDVTVAVVVEGPRVVGIFTRTDAMQMLERLLRGGVASERRSFPPAEVRARIFSEHLVLRGLLKTVRGLAVRVRAHDKHAATSLHERAWTLYHALLRHLDLEDAILAPALRDSDAFGPLRAEELTREHQRQRACLLSALNQLDDTAVSWAKLAHDIEVLASDLLDDMVREEREMLSANLLEGDAASNDSFTG